MSNTAEKVLSAVSAYKVKQTAPGQYRMNSPLRPGSNSHAFVLHVDNGGEHGTYYDHVSGEKGSLYDLAERLNIEVPRHAVAETKRVYANLEEYATAHGITAEDLRGAGWTETVHDGRKALQFPTMTGTRYRFLDGEKPYYKSEQGYKSCWYGLKKAAVMATKTGMPLVICNGEISTIAAQFYRIPACAITSGEKRIPDHLLDELRSTYTGEIIIAMDCDETGRRVAQDIQAQLPEARIADLGLGRGGDLADFCQLHDNDSAEALLHSRLDNIIKQDMDVGDLPNILRELAALRKNEARNAEITLPDLLDKAQREIDELRQKDNAESIRSFADLVSENHNRLRERRLNPNPVQGLCSGIPGLDKVLGGFVGGRIHMIYGDTNMGKSTLAATITAGFLKAGAGLAVTTESLPGVWLDKLVSAMTDIPYDLIETGQLNDDQYNAVIGAYSTLETTQCHILDSGSPSPHLLNMAVRDGLYKYGYKWVVIDSISKMKYPGINDIYDTTRLVADAIQDLCRETQLPFLVTCQIGRNMKDRANKMPLPNDALGAGTIEQNADVIMSLYNHNHYVKLGVAQPNLDFPEDSAVLRITKHRFKPAQNKAVWLKFVGGSRFYEMAVREIHIPDYMD